MSAPARGRRRGSPDTRAAILTSARERFAAVGFSGTTIRAVAGDAGVDPALVHHYFGSKDDLFVAALELPVDPRQVIAERIAAGAPDHGPGERILRAILGVWDDPSLQPGLLAVVRRLLEPGGDRLVRDGFLPVVLEPVGALLGVQDAATRMPLAASQVIGVILMRYVVLVEPLASMPIEQVVAIYAPALDGFLTGPLPLAPPLP
ncbi:MULTISPECIES: TetR/AcrR family transcriptional regulator [unclassified Nocardioides]|uniref:TetR/AcrR family transcriptional regulator n=1 Tax=unclassified Nocardioides TaxID=2615069 RepID=UPI0006F6CE1B|nr:MULTISPECIES: TetR family transcriptional regulator [unclassified Nocardioides]KRA29976.1 TetR family transcriptional regulator [Nocardioides sp. Root614]KRA86897.1 TetR family transcriptional regulator [Nocardioides sp. Root682]